MTEAAIGNWDKDFADDQNNTSSGASETTKGQFSGPKTEYLKMDKSGTYKIRLVGPYVKFRKHFKPYRATVQDSEKDLDPAWVAGFWPQERYAINVIDRADNKLKVVEKPKSLFKFFHAYRAATNIDPTDKDGTDWAITVKIPLIKSGPHKGEPDKLKTEYTAMPLDKTPFTKEDYKLIKKLDEQGNFIKDENGKTIPNLWPLKKIYKSTPAEVMKKMWDELPADKKIPPKKEKDGEKAPAPAAEAVKQTGAEPIEERMEDAPAQESDMFESEGAGKDTDNSSELF